MKKILFVLGTLLLLFNCTTKIRALTAGSKVIDDYVGIWGYESNEKDNDAIIFNLSLRKKRILRLLDITVASWRMAIE